MKKVVMRDLASAIDTLGSSHNMRRERPYDGQPHTSEGVRGSTEISGITFRDLRDCYIRAMCLSMGIENPAHYAEAGKGETATLCENDLYELKGTNDPMAVLQNLSCEIERLMGIYPNVPGLMHNEKVRGCDDEN